jgi:hypothetical protein
VSRREGRRHRKLLSDLKRKGEDTHI